MLRRVEIQGFKTFAARTSLDLEPGVTAIVGPNGSGKSNLTEAVRWVLGEQSLRAIRSRKTEDVIFAGSGRRAPSGMAEVTVTLDNSAGSLPLPFAEVSVSRRAYRSGENEYLINGERARLRDVSDLLSRAGLAANSHVVVGQGLVDSALSARPEERRALFEDAAAISHHQARLADSREKLALTEGNLSRVADIAAEIAPRLPQLARQAERARQALALRAELESLLFAWYGQSWRELRSRLERLAAEESDAAATVERDAAALARLEESLVGLVARRDAAQRDLAERQRVAAELSQAVESLQRDLVAENQRRESLGARLAETERDLADADATRENESKALEAARAGLTEVEARIAELALRLASSERENAAAVADRRARETRLRATESETSRAAVTLAETRARAAASGERKRSLGDQLAKLRRDAAASAERLAQARQRRIETEASLALVVQAQEALVGERAAADEGLAAARARQHSLATERTELERQLRQLEARRDLLVGWRDSQSGYYSGVRAVLQAARKPAGAGGLTGIVGPVGELVEVPVNLETAIEVALGGHLQDVVVDRWEHAEAAIDLLKGSGSGRATFLPLDTLRASAGGRSPVGAPGILGIARDLVSFEARLAVVFENLLGHTLVVEDLPTARRVLRQLTGGWQIVTVGGEIVRTSGAVTGGSVGQAQRGVLARERELRGLPARITALAEGTRAKAQALAAARDDEGAALASLASFRRREQELSAERRTQEGALSIRRRESETLDQQSRWAAAEEARLSGDLEWLDGESRTMGEAIALAESKASESASALDRLRAELASADEGDREQARRAAEVRSARAVAEAERRGLVAEVERRTGGLARAERLVGERESRLTDLRREAAQLRSSLEADAARLATARTRAAEARSAVAPAASDLAGTERETRDLEVARSAARSALDATRESERRASLQLERARVESAGLVRQIELDLGPTEESDDGLSVQLGGASRPLVGETPEGINVSTRIAELRRALRGAGSASPEVVAEYETSRARHEFLTTQARDLEAAAETLRQAIGELEETMQRRFLVTFDAVGKVFERNFTQLFGGGSAQLTLTLPERPGDSGIEIVVQLPGKRGRGLAQLSGGERALTAVALIFALLEVNPTPFCVFDEVDAALDEANIDRFCDLLRERARLTQFLVITHNRRTMEAAGALYGLSMEDRSVSRVFSLKLAEVTAGG